MSDRLRTNDYGRTNYGYHGEDSLREDYVGISRELGARNIEQWG